MAFYRRFRTSFLNFSMGLLRITVRRSAPPLGDLSGMMLFEILRRDKFQRFVLTVRQEGLLSGLKKTWRYLSARLQGHGLSSLHQNGSGPILSSEYMNRVWLELAEKQAFHISTAPALLQKRRKIVLIGDLNLPQCRKYRAEQLAELWALEGVEYGFSHYEDVRRSVALLQDATHVIFYRLRSTPVTSMLAYEARRLRLPILYDLDDPLFSVSAYGTYQNMNALPLSQRSRFVNEAPRYLDVMNSADIVSVSTPSLIEHTKKLTPRPVHLRRNFADRTSLKAGARAMGQVQRDDVFRLCFASGSHGHEVDFAQIQKDVFAFLEKDRTRKLMILGHFDNKLLPSGLGDQIEVHPFSSYRSYLGTLAAANVAVMPLADDAFNRCKSGVRVIDAASVGVPSLVGNISDMAALVNDHETGKVLGAGDSWLGNLEALASDRAGLRAMGRAARKALENNWAAGSNPRIIDPELLDWVHA